MRGQVSIEQMFVTSLGITFVAILFFLSVFLAADTVRDVQAKDSVERIARAADLIYAMGPGSETSVEVLMPDNVKSTDVSGNRVLITVGMTSGDTDIFSFSDGQLNGTLTTSSGRQKVSLFVDNSSVIHVNSTG